MSNFLIKGAALPTKNLTGPQNHHNILIQWKKFFDRNSQRFYLEERFTRFAGNERLQL